MIAATLLGATTRRRAYRGRSVVGPIDDSAEPNPDVDISSLIAGLVAARRKPGPDELRPIRAYVVARALRRRVDVPAQREISGLRVGRSVLRTGDPIDARVAKYLRHAVRQEQWPSGTTFDEYLQSLIEVVEADDGGIFVDLRGARWVVTFVARSGIWEGEAGGPFIVVMYDCEQERLTTAFQPDRGLAYVEDNEQVVNGTWLRKPR